MNTLLSSHVFLVCINILCFHQVYSAFPLSRSFVSFHVDSIPIPKPIVVSCAQIPSSILYFHRITMLLSCFGYVCAVFVFCICHASWFA